MDALKLIAQDSLKAEVPSFDVGDSVRVHVKIKEGDRERIQVFEGTVIAKKHGGVAETFTVRRVSHGCGVERVFPLHSPSVDKAEVIRQGRVPRETVLPQRQSGQGCESQIQNQIVLMWSKPALYQRRLFSFGIGPDFTNCSVFSDRNPWKNEIACAIIHLSCCRKAKEKTLSIRTFYGCRRFVAFPWIQ